MFTNEPVMSCLRQCVAIIFLESCFVWTLVRGNCDTSSCPIVCSDAPCPAPGSASVTIFPLTGCQEVVINSPGYPHGYVGTPCEWNFVMDADLRTSTVLRWYDVYVTPGDDITITGLRDGGGSATITFYSGCGTCVNPNNQITRSVTSFQFAFTPAQTVYEGGFSARFTFSERAATDACSTTETITLTTSFPVAAFNSPRFPATYDLPSECYYTITSPADTEILLEFIGNLDVNPFEDFVYIYDNLAPADPKLLRIVSDVEFRNFREIYTYTRSVQVAFKTTSGTKANGFFVRVSYEDYDPENIPEYQYCRGNGALIDQCDCSTYTAGQVCMFDAGTDYEPITPPTMAGTSTCGETFELTFDASMANVILFPNSYFTFVLDAAPCVWTFQGPEFSYHAIIFRDFALEIGVDEFTIIYDDFRRAFGFIMYSSDVTDLPYTRDGTTFDLIGTPIIIDYYRFKVKYSGNTATPATYRGPLFEVHLLGVGLCSTPCLNGGQCSGYCDCDDGFQGKRCEQTTPADFTCVVKNPYISPHFAYPVQLHASPGRPSISPYEISFDLYRHKGGYSFYDSLPTNSKRSVEPHTVALSLPSTCDTKEGSSRLGVFVCSVKGHEFIESIDIPAIVNPKSEFLSPVGRFTKTVSVGDAQATFTVNHLPSVQQALRWKFNGIVQQKWNGQSTITITNIKTSDGGIYECFIREGYHKHFDVVRYRLIVRECPDGMYGPPDCSGTCPTCQNGGTCSDVYGTCVCPPTYTGTLCDEVFDQGTISRLNDHITCPHLGLSSDRCTYVMLCLPDPGGCLCMPGLTGSACNKPCPPLKYGLECLFDCSCGAGIQCNAATGACP